MELKVVELFAGVGGFRVGLNKIKEFDIKTGLAIENKTWEFVWANQYEPSKKIQHAYNCYVTRFGKENNSNEDISLVDKSIIPNHSLLVGGFPCQDYSVARSLNGEKGIEGKKGVLFWEIVKILEMKNTPFILLENVDRLLKSPSSKRGRDFAIMLKVLDELNYNVEWRIINAGDYSMPQKRKRIFIFAYKRTTKYSKKNNYNLNNNLFNVNFPLKLENEETKDLRIYKDILDINDNYNQGKFLDTGIMIDGKVINSNIIVEREKIYPLSKVIEKNKYSEEKILSYVIDEEKLKKWEYLKNSKKIERVTKSGHKYIYSEGKMAFPENLDEPARTMLTSEGTLNRSSHIIFDERIKNYRILTENECEIIQMFPQNWTNTMPSRSRYFMMGNALVTGVLNRIEETLRGIIENE